MSARQLQRATDRAVTWPQGRQGRALPKAQPLERALAVGQLPSLSVAAAQKQLARLSAQETPPPSPRLAWLQLGPWDAALAPEQDAPASEARPSACWLPLLGSALQAEALHSRQAVLQHPISGSFVLHGRHDPRLMFDAEA